MRARLHKQAIVGTSAFLYAYVGADADSGEGDAIWDSVEICSSATDPPTGAPSPVPTVAPTAVPTAAPINARAALHACETQDAFQTARAKLAQERSELAKTLSDASARPSKDA